MAERRFRIIILGAGFSSRAGLPLGAQLYKEVYRRSRLSKSKEFLDKDLERFIEYKRLSEGITLSPEEIDFEEFLSFLDVEHYLWIRGSDTWSVDGNESQLIIKYFIGETIHNNTPSSDKIPVCYLTFVQNLEPGDIILTFNYDIMLERCLDYIKKPYRLFPHKSKVSDHSEIDNGEIVILKVHGSVDWFNRTEYSKREIQHRKDGFDGSPNDTVFGEHNRYSAKPLLDDPSNHENPLSQIYRINRVEEFYSNNNEMLATPWILSPSYSKILYADIVRELFYGINRAGFMNYGAGIIGYSLPSHDKYIRQIVYTIVRNYQESEQTLNVGDIHLKKTNFKIINLCRSQEEESALRCRYRFVNWDRADLYVKGFDQEAVSMIFDLT